MEYPDTLIIEISFLRRKCRLGLNTDYKETRMVTHSPSNDPSLSWNMYQAGCPQ